MMKLKTIFTTLCSFLLFALISTSNGQTNLLQGPNMEAATGWSETFLNSEATNPPTVAWGDLTDAPAAGVSGNLHVSGIASASWVNVGYAIYQPVTLSTTETYTFDGAFKALKYGDSWLEVYLGTKPADGSDYGAGQNKITVVGAWDQPANDDGVFSVDASNYNAFTPDTSGTYYFVLKMGTGNPDNGFDFIVDELTLKSRSEPIVKFKSDVSTAFPSGTISFTDESIYPVSWAWDFGDGSTSTDQNPTHAYTALGKYTVTLAVTNEIGTTSLIKTEMIEITEPPVEVTAGGILVGGEMESETAWSTSFLNSGAETEPTATWGYTPDGPTAGNGGSLHITGSTTAGNSQYCIYQAVELSKDSVYTFEGAFKLIQVNNTWCEVFIGEKPIDGLDYRAEDGFKLSLLAGAGTWATPKKNDGTFSIDASPYNLYVPDTSGTYYFVIKAGSTSWDGSDQTHEIIIDELSLTKSRVKPVTAFSADKPLGFAPLTVSFIDESKFATAWEWNFGDGSALSNEQNPIHEFAKGTFTVTLKATNELGDSILSKADFIKANEKPALPAGEKLYGGNMEDPNLWNITKLNANGTSEAEWNYTAVVPLSGAGGNLHVTGSALNATSHYCIWQPVELHEDSIYNFDAAFKDLTGVNQFWTEVFIGNTAPIDGEDYGVDSIRIANFNTWESCTGNMVDGTFQNDACIKMPNFKPHVTGTFYFVIKIGATEWEGNQVDYDVIIDELSLKESTYFATPITNFFSDVVSGDAPLTVYFTDQSENATAWKWMFGDGLSSIEQSPQHTYDTPGLYTVTLIAYNGNLSDTLVVADLIEVNEGVDVEGFNTEAINVYPNPSYGQVHFDLPESTSGVLRVTGLLGNEIMRRELENESQITIELENKGVYLLIINSNKNQFISKIVIK